MICTVPENVASSFEAYSTPLKRYGKDVHAIYKPTNDREATSFALKAFLDLYFEERGHSPLAAHKAEAEAIHSEYFRCLMPDVSVDDVAQLLSDRRFVVSGRSSRNGKDSHGSGAIADEVRGARTIDSVPSKHDLRKLRGRTSAYGGGGRPRIPIPTGDGSTNARRETRHEAKSQPFLLHIDEINRADLSKVLGEAVMLLEYSEEPRNIKLPHDFGPPFHNSFSLPPNLHILGTMNSADRSIAILDVAIRRRFAFVKLWPQFGVVQQFKCSLADEAYRRLLSVFTEYASDDAFALTPGHSYFIAKDGKDETALRSLQVNLLPLLEEYLAQGYVTSFADHIRGYCQWVQSLKLAEPRSTDEDCAHPDVATKAVRRSGELDKFQLTRILLADTSTKSVPASVLARTAAGDSGREAHLAHLFIDRNQKTLGQFKIDARVDFDGNRVYVVFQSGSTIGAFPLVSPTFG